MSLYFIGSFITMVVTTMVFFYYLKNYLINEKKNNNHLKGKDLAKFKKELLLDSFLFFGMFLCILYLCVILWPFIILILALFPIIFNIIEDL